MPTLDIDGRGKTVEEAVQDLWERVKPLQEKGYHPVTSVEIVDAKTKKVLERYLVTDPEFIDHIKAAKPKESKKDKREHKPPRPHEFAVIARLRVES